MPTNEPLDLLRGTTVNFAEHLPSATHLTDNIPPLFSTPLLLRLNELGYRVGIRALDLLVWRDKNSKRETRVLGMLYFIHTTVWKTMFGKQADSLEKSTENEDECTLPHFFSLGFGFYCDQAPIIMSLTIISGRFIDMISDNDPMVSKFISIPKDVSQLNCGAFMAGIVEAIMDGCQFVSRPSAFLIFLTPFYFDS